MSVLIDLGIKQGTVIGFSSQLTAKNDDFKSLVEKIRNGRYGLSRDKGVNTNYLYVVLTQDCTISSGKPIELAQLKKTKVNNAKKVENLLLGKDYSKLYLKYDGDFYEAEETLLTKVKNEDLASALVANNLCIHGHLESKRILLDWRVLAYFREPFPHKFNMALMEYFRSSEFWFSNFLLENQDNIHSVRVFVTPEDNENADLYKFSITLLLTKEGEEHEEYISSSLDQMLMEFNNTECVDNIQAEDFDTESMDFPEHLVVALTSPLDDFSFANAYVMREFNFQYLCY